MSGREPTQHELLQQGVTALLKATGWRWLHVRRSIAKGNKWATTTNVKGWPDLAPLWNPRQPGRFLAIELKIPESRARTDTVPWRGVGTKVSPEQAEVLAELEASGMEVYVITPRGLQELATILQRRRGADYPASPGHTKGPPT